MRYCFNNSGIMETVEFSDEDVQSIFLPLLRELTRRQRNAGDRLLVMMAAPPGAGKSTLAAFLQHLSRQDPELTPITVIGMDGFHRYQEDLLSHTTMRDGAEICLVKIKGAPITFDRDKLEERIRKLKEASVEETVGWPVYDRKLHNPVENAVTVEGSIVLLEGNYLLLEQDGWNRLRNYADYTIRITAEEEILRERLVSRRISTGVSREDAAVFVDFSDMVNVRTCLLETGPVDLELQIREGRPPRYQENGK